MSHQVLPRTARWAAVLARYSEFFALIEDFSGYTDSFPLQDLVTDNEAAVEFFMPFDDFSTPLVPQDVASYKEYRRRSIKFIRARNRRIEHLQIALAGGGSPVRNLST